MPAAAEVRACGPAIAQFANPFRHKSTDRMRKSTAGPRPIHRGVGWGFVISGSVRDTSGSPVSGARILLGTEVVLSNDAGAVMLRRKRPGSVTVRVDLDQFQQPGK